MPSFILIAPSLLLLLLASVATAGEGKADYARPLDSLAWEMHFEAWVQRVLVADELAAAADHPLPPDLDGPLRIVDERIAARIVALTRRPSLPESARPDVVARGVDRRSLEAVRLYSAGKVEEALALLESPELATNAKAVHLRVQLRDEQHPQAAPAEVIDRIDEYRYALSLSEDLPAAPRARIRMAQLYLDVGFWAEAAAELRTRLEPPLPGAWARQATITFAEASYLNGDAEAALAAIDSLDPNDLDASERRWMARRRADSSFRAGSYEEAAREYQALLDAEALVDADGTRREPDLSIALLVSLARIRLGETEGPERQLRRAIALADDAEPRLLAGLLLARLLRGGRAFDQMIDVAGETLESASGDRDRAITAVYALEAERLAGRTPPERLVEVRDLVRKRTEVPELGLLSYVVAILPSPDAGADDTRARLLRLLRKLPEGTIHSLIESETSRLVHQELAAAYRGEQPPDPRLLRSLENDLEPDRIEENGVLMAIEALQGTRHWDACARWARSLRKREVRPIRRGLGAWREIQCRRLASEDAIDPQRMMRIADSGLSGPFALAIAAIAAEQLIRGGQTEEAISMYERGLSSFVEPRILGPLLLRLGELQTAVGRDSLATRRIVRGLALTDAAELAGDPLRKAAIITLAQLSERRRRTQRLATTLRAERRRVPEWWTSAYDYLGYRIGAARAPTGTDLFARGAAELREVEALEARIQKLGLDLEPAKAEKGEEEK